MPIYETVILQIATDGSEHVLDDIRTVVAKNLATAKIEALRLNPPPLEVPSNEVRVIARLFEDLVK